MANRTFQPTANGDLRTAVNTKFYVGLPELHWGLIEARSLQSQIKAPLDEYAPVVFSGAQKTIKVTSAQIFKVVSSKLKEAGYDFFQVNFIVNDYDGRTEDLETLRTMFPDLSDDIDKALGKGGEKTTVEVAGEDMEVDELVEVA